MQSSKQEANVSGIRLMVLALILITVVAKTQMPSAATAKPSRTGVHSPAALAARGLVRELASALASGDEASYLSLWHFDPSEAEEKKARVIKAFRERPDRRQEVARGLLAALAVPDALSVIGVDESLATFDYTYRNFRRNRTVRASMILRDGVWHVTHVF